MAVLGGAFPYSDDQECAYELADKYILPALKS